MASWIATALGLGGGVALVLFAAQAVLPRLIRTSPDPRRVVRLAFGGALAALLPAALLAVVGGATLGGRWGASGMALGTALVFALVILAGAAAGLALARVLRRSK